MLWGGLAPWGAASTHVLAYERQGPEEGGAVLLQDGTIKQMTAAELQAALQARPRGS